LRSPRCGLSSERRWNREAAGALVRDGHHPTALRAGQGHDSPGVLLAGDDSERLILVAVARLWGSKIRESQRATNHKHDQPKAPQGPAMVA